MALFYEGLYLHLHRLSLGLFVFFHEIFCYPHLRRMFPHFFPHLHRQNQRLLLLLLLHSQVVLEACWGEEMLFYLHLHRQNQRLLLQPALLLHWLMGKIAVLDERLQDHRCSWDDHHLLLRCHYHSLLGQNGQKKEKGAQEKVRYQDLVVGCHFHGCHLPYHLHYYFHQSLVVELQDTRAHVYADLYLCVVVFFVPDRIDVEGVLCRGNVFLHCEKLLQNLLIAFLFLRCARLQLKKDSNYGQCPQAICRP